MVTTLDIDGMRTVHCARAIFTSLAAVDGIAKAEVVVGRATLEHERPLDLAALAAAVEAAGYRLRATTTDRRQLSLLSDDAHP